MLISRTDPNPPFQAIIIDSTRSGQMIQQSDLLANLTFGYEKGGFTGRISLIFQGKTLDRIGRTEKEDSFTDDYLRWDLVMQQQIIEGISIFANINNFTDRPETSSLGVQNFSTREEFFGWTGDVGLKYEF